MVDGSKQDEPDKKVRRKRKATLLGDLKGEKPSGSLGKRIAWYLARKGWSQSELVRRANVFVGENDSPLQRQYISNYLLDRHIPSNSMLHAIAKAFGCEVADLVPPEAANLVDNRPTDRVYVRFNKEGDMATLNVRDVVVPMPIYVKIMQLLNGVAEPA